MLERLFPGWVLRRLTACARLQESSAERRGEWFEYAFADKPHGVGSLGRWLDRHLLAAPYWQALRAISTEAISFLDRYVGHRRQFKIPTRILDVSPGTAPYLRAWLQRAGGHDLEVICLRPNLALLDYARQLVEQAQISRLLFLAGDALDAPSYLGNDADVILCLDAATLCRTRADVTHFLALTHDHLHPLGVCLVGLPPTRPRVHTHARQSEWDEKIWPRSMEEQGFVDLFTTRVHPAGTVIRGWKRLTENRVQTLQPAPFATGKTG